MHSPQGQRSECVGKLGKTVQELFISLSERENLNRFPLFTMACEHLYKSKILRPGVTVLERLVISARQHAQQQTYDTMASILKPDTCTFLDSVLDVDDAIGRTPLYWLKYGATSNTPDDKVK